MYSSGSKSIINNWIYRNGLLGSAYDSSGIYLNDSSGDTLIRNNTIYDNRPYGIEMVEEGSDPNISNCIIWDPNTDDLYNCSATYSCIRNPADACGLGNTTADPCFYNSDVNDFHLKGDSLCIDTGTGTYPNETDIDGESRVIDGDWNWTEVVDIGADEYYWPKADYNGDKIVNFLDYSIFADNWLDVNSTISLDADPNVDIDDLALFCAAWLWYAPWGDNFSFLGMGGGDDMSGLSFASDEGRATSDGLMIPDVAASLEAMPDSLYAKVERFYTVAPAQPVYLSPQERAAIVADMLAWLDEIWLSGDLEGQMTYEDYLAFREALLLFTGEDY